MMLTFHPLPNGPQYSSIGSLAWTFARRCPDGRCLFAFYPYAFGGLGRGFPGRMKDASTPRPLPSLTDDPLVRTERPKTTALTESTLGNYFFFLAFFATFFFAAFFFAFGMRATPFIVPFGSDESLAPQNVNNMSGLQFDLQYVPRFRENAVSQKVHLTRNFIDLY